MGLNSCVVGDEEVLGGQSAVFEPGAKVRIWPYTLTFEAEKAAAVTRERAGGPSPLDHGRIGAAHPSQAAGTARPLRVREPTAAATPQSILLLENNIEDVCRDLGVFAAENEALLEEITGLTLRDHLVNQLIMETGTEEYFDLASLTSNEFDVPATLVPEREAELHALLQFAPRAARFAGVPRRDRAGAPRGDAASTTCFHLVRPHLHHELRKYLILRHAEEGPEGHDFRLRAAAGPAAGADRDRNHGRGQRLDLRRAGRA